LYAPQVDEGWLLGMHSNGTIYEDRTKFPAGMKALGDFIHGLGLLYGLYTCRGSCQCGTSTYSGPGSQGHEAADVAWIVAQGADWLKVDSCCASQDHGVAFAEYALFRDALNASGRPVAFNLVRALLSRADIVLHCGHGDPCCRIAT